MSHHIARDVPPVSRDGAGPLHLADTERREWDIVMTRDQRWVLCRSGLSDPEEVRRQLEWFRMGDPSGNVTYRVIERTITLREELLELEAPAVVPQRARRPRPQRSDRRVSTTAGRAPGETLGQQLRRLRRERGLSQSDLAGPACSASLVSLVEAGKRTPGPGVLAHLVTRLDIDVDDFTLEDPSLGGPRHPLTASEGVDDGGVDDGRDDDDGEALW